MALPVYQMRAIIRENGHLILEGDERKEDLKEALLNLRTHTYMQCKKVYLGTPIDSLLPTISVLTAPSTRKRNVESVGTSHKRL